MDRPGDNAPLPLATGLFGSAYAFALLAAYGRFLVAVPDGGPLVRNVLSGTPFGAEHELISRTFFDVSGVLVVTFAAMACWEKLRPLAYKTSVWVWAAVSATGAMTVTLTGGGAPATRLGLTSFELVLLATVLGFGALVGVFAWRERRPAFRCDLFSTGVRRGLSRWLAGGVGLVLVALVSLGHPYWQTPFFANWRLTISHLVLIYAVLGLPYAVLTNWLRFSDDPRSDPTFALLAVERQLLLSMWRRRPGRLWRLVRRRWVKVSLMDLFCVKFFFLPVMLSFVFTEAAPLLESVQRVHSLRSAARALFPVALHGVLVIDVVVGALGYSGSSRWLDNKSRSVDPTVSGWAWALFCYPPFNQSAGTLFPFRSQHAAGLVGPGVAAALPYVMLVFFSIYTLATVSFGLRFSNMTNRGIIRHGPYAYVRHPAYVSKAVAWLCELLPRAGSLLDLVSWGLFSGVYVMRALTEERHLMTDPEYRDYAARVRWRFIPYVW